MNKYLLWFFICILVFGVCSCDCYVIKHPYALYEDNFSYVSIIDVLPETSSATIQPHILEYAVFEEWIIGRTVEVVFEMEEGRKFCTPEGYFVFNTNTKERLDGMSKSEFDAFLQKNLGIKEIPRMREPDFSIYRNFRK